MMPTRQGSFHLFRLFGVNVFLHWSWFLVALYEIQSRGHSYESMVWNGIEYLALFLIVLMHEFGHALACRQVGGRADQIVLWPLGGVAYVSPPQRPGAMLWSIAAGPLVNVALAPILFILSLASRSFGWSETMPNAHLFLDTILFVNLMLLVFNLMPFYPLDGGQILRSLLWFFLGRARSLMVATSIGFVGVAGLIAYAVWAHSIWIGIMSVFIVMNCWNGLMHARALSKIARFPRREGFACPRCRTAPPLGALWVCGRCGKPFDTFETGALCPHCGTQYGTAACVECGESSPMPEWFASTPAPPKQ
jgi:Zn-dependent protease